MRAVRLGIITSSSVYAAIVATFAIAVSAFAGGGSMYSPGALNAESGNRLGGVSSHAEIAGNCKACHAAPWEADTMDDRCSACHVDVAAELLDPGSPHGRMMQIDPQAKCMTCHPEHRGRDALLTIIEGWQFPHEVSRFKLNGHQLMAENEPFRCADCHGEDVTSFDPLTCLECHLGMDMAFMVEHQFTFGENCLECHDGVDRFGDDFDHNQFAFKLTGRHTPVKCSQCHAGATTVSALQATSQNCLSCHANDDVHAGSLGADCAACHSPDGWSPSTFDHNRSVFKLTGAHVQVACETCHVNGVFKGTPQTCFACHQQDDAHMGQLGTACESCHRTEAWKPAQFDHNTTAFQLTGAHVNAQCKACHINGIYKNTPKDCFSCHASSDVHKGEYGRNCGECHSTTKWSGAKFDHNATAFPLIGNHVKVQCKACHTSGVFRGTPKNCFACHAQDDNHQGQLGTDCSICHAPTGWKPITFDHNASAFPLTGAHTSLACTQCHASARFKIPTECASCHGEPVFHADAFGTNCVQCHTTSEWSSGKFMGSHPVALGQNFLDHHGATCRTCHVPTVHTFTCLACHETNPLSPDDPSIPTSPPAEAPRVLTSIDSATIPMGGTSQLSVQLNNIPAQGYTSTEFTCTYDPVLVEVGDISVASLFGTDAVAGISGPQNGSFIVAVAGSKGQKATGNGVAFTFTATGIQAGSTNMECKARVSEGLNALQSIESQSSILTVAALTSTTAHGAAQTTITGQVLANKVVTIRIDNPDNSAASTTTANPDGTFSLSVPPGTYTITASADGFLSARGSLTLTDDGTFTQPPVRLIAGDIDGNGVIDAMDALTIRINYNLNVPSAADINNDGEINVLDLGILAENYGKAGAIPWP